MALALLPVADLGITGHDPWAELTRVVQGLLAPDFTAIGALSWAAALTVAFALCGVTIGGVAGYLLAPLYRFTAIQLLCPVPRPIHKLFWSIFPMQINVLSLTIVILALAIPYAGIFAKVFSEYLDQADPRPVKAMPVGSDFLSVFLFARLPLALKECGTYAL